MYKNSTAGLTDDYYLTKFKPGDTTWQYVADTRYKNLALGENKYIVTVYQDDAVLGTDSVTISLTQLPGRGQTVSVDWQDELIFKQTEDYVDHYLVGKVTSGTYQGQDLYLLASGTMGGYDFEHYVIKDGAKIRFKEAYIKIADLVDLPETLNLPGIKYQLEKSYEPMQLFSEFKPIKTLLTDEKLGEVYLAYPKYIYEARQKGEELQLIYTCIVAKLKNHTAQIYDLPISFYQSNVVDITFTDGQKNQASYTNTEYATCGSYCTPLTVEQAEDLQPDQRLKIAGTTAGGETLYEFADPKDSFLLELYQDKNTIAYWDQGRPLEENQYTYEEFLAQHPVLFWQDSLGRWIRFKNIEVDKATDFVFTLARSVALPKQKLHRLTP